MNKFFFKFKQIFLAKIAQPHAAYSAVQLQPVQQKFAYAGPQVTFGPQPIGRHTNFIPSQPVPVVSYAAASTYAPVQYNQPQYQSNNQYRQQPQYQNQQPYQIQPLYQQSQPQQHQSESHIPTTGPLAYQNSYAFVPMQAISLQVHTPSIQNQGIITHTQALAPPTHSAVPAQLQLVYPHIASTQAAKTLTPVYGGYQQGQQYSQNPHTNSQSAYGKFSFISLKHIFLHTIFFFTYFHLFIICINSNFCSTANSSCSTYQSITNIIIVSSTITIKYSI